MKEEIIEKVIEEVKIQDTERLIYNPKDIYIRSYSGNSFQISFDKKMRNAYNTLWIHLTPRDDGSYEVREEIQALNTPRHGKYLFFMYDNIEGFDPTNFLLTPENIPQVIHRLLQMGYSVWGNHWGYITKAGRQAWGRLRTDEKVKIIRKGDDLDDPKSFSKILNK